MRGYRKFAVAVAELPLLLLEEDLIDQNAPGAAAF